MKWLVCYATILHCKAILGRSQPGRMMNFVMNHAPGAGSYKNVQDYNCYDLYKNSMYTLCKIATLNIFRFMLWTISLCCQLKMYRQLQKLFLFTVYLADSLNIVHIARNTCQSIWHQYRLPWICRYVANGVFSRKRSRPLVSGLPG